MKKNSATLSGDLRKSRMEASHAKELAKSMRQDIKRLREKLFRAEQDIAEKEALHSREREEQRSRECEELRSEGDARQELLKTTHAQVIQISELTDELEKNRLDILAMKAQQQNDLKTVQEEAEDQRVTHLQKEKAIRLGRTRSVRRDPDGDARQTAATCSSARVTTATDGGRRQTAWMAAPKRAASGKEPKECTKDKYVMYR
jgi:hypothetical protein